MNNTIAQRIYDFLKNFPPFSMLSYDELISICKSMNVHYVPQDNFVFKKGEKVKDHFYVVKDGAVGIFRDGTNVLVDHCDEGDIFGLRALMRQGSYTLSAKAIEESIIYSVSSSMLKDYITTNADASTFLMRSFVSNAKSIEQANSMNSSYNSFEEKTLKQRDFSEVLTIDYSKDPVCCGPEKSIQEAAIMMTERHVGSIVITYNKNPIGIITDKDLRVRIATGKVSINENVTKIMSSPVITVPRSITVDEAQIIMLKNRITHLCITSNGTPESELIGILSEHDMVAIRENNASVLVKEIKRAKSAEQLYQIRQRAHHLLKRYIEQQIPITLVTKIISAINNSISTKIIELAVDSMPNPPPVSYAWLAIGSQGRQEQLLLTDQDNALVFDDVPEEKYDTVQRYFIELAKIITKGLNTVGFEFCPADMMGRNPKWCLSLSQWQHQFKRWITLPDQDNLMLCTIFFDFELIYGSKELVEKMSEGIFESIDSHEIFLNYLGVNALKNPPPLSFFRQFLVEDDGEHKNQFDIKARAMMPLVDAARLLTLSKNSKAFNNTIARFNLLAELEPQNKDLYEACVEAFKELLRFRTEQGLLHDDSGRFIDLKSLSKGNRLELKSSFKAIKDVQELIQTRFRLAQFL